MGINESIQNRYDFVILFDVKDGNPNGDPDAGNLPRVDAETGHGLVTDVCLKRKVRNYIALKEGYKEPYDIYIKEKAVLGRAHVEAFKDLGISLGEESRIPIPENIVEVFQEQELPEGVSIEEDDENLVLVIVADADVKRIKAELKEIKPPAQVRKFIEANLKDVKARKPTADEVDKGRKWMCNRFYDIRTFGAVLSLKSAPNCGQVRGPVQFTFARSVDPIVSLEHSITRMAVATEAEAEKQGGDNRTMGRKFTVPYGLYRAHGFISAPLANQTGFSERDLELLWEALENMFEHDRSAARGLMGTKKLVIFKHDSKMGNAPVQQLFDAITVKRKDEGTPARDFNDYMVSIAKEQIPQGITLIERL
ncbi:MAG TPA: type I-C CRISPR-associated protein Cas7/Csd2 [Firmicutes bacterium]|jgi:CRISPR-associated protein Csd2|nr:type I-C CRISPR-associated protein Cas7/Csd2 [Bacillota bacterium]